MDRCKILFFCKNLEGGGAERSAVEVLSHVDRDRFDMKMLLGDLKGAYLSTIDRSLLLDEEFARLPFSVPPQVSSAIHRAASSSKVPIVSVPYRRVRRASEQVRARTFNRAHGLPQTYEGLRHSRHLLMSAPLRRLRAAIRNYRPDIVISTLMESGAAHAFAAKQESIRKQISFKWVAVEQNNTHDRARQYFPDPKVRQFWDTFTRVAYSEADRVVAVSEGVKQGLLEHYGCSSSKVVVVPNPVRQHDVESAAPIERTKPFFLAAGRLHPQKQFDHLITAFASIADTTDADLVIIGEGTERCRLETLISELKVESRVFLPGFADNIWSYMKSAVAFVLSSQYEGFPLVLIEAAAAGCPLVSYDCRYGPVEIIRHEDNGLLVSAGRTDELAQAMLRVARQPELAARFASNARETARLYNSARIAERYQDVFGELVGCAGGKARRGFNGSEL